MPPFVEPKLRSRTAALLKEYQLEPAIVYSSGPLHEAGNAEKTLANVLEVADFAKTIGTTAVNFSLVAKPGEVRKSDEELSTQAGFVNRLARELKVRGLRLFLHNHTFEMAENAREWRHLVRHTDPDVGICLDVSWVVRGQQDPMALLGAAGSRLRSVHLRNSREGAWLEAFGEGDIDYAKIAAHLKRIGFDGFLVVELVHDETTQVTHTLEENLRLSREAARRIFEIRTG